MHSLFTLRLPLPTLLLLAAVVGWPYRVGADEAAEPEPAPIPEVEVGSVVIEAEPAPEGPTVDQLLEQFREHLRTERTLAPIERPLAGGMVEVKTRYGRFCVPSPNAFNTSSLTGNFGLASLCAFY
jgi:hypothetical protein